MDTSEEIIQRMDMRLQAMGEPEPLSPTEFLRTQEVFMAEKFGLGRPVFRSSLDLRFHGRAVQMHDLYAKTCTSTVDKIVDLVEQAGNQIASIRGPVKVFFSPAVLQGSTVITLFGEPRTEIPNQDPLSIGIADTPLDAAMNVVFKSIDLVSSAQQDVHLSSLNLPGPIGKRLFLLTEQLLSHNVDLDLTWTRPSGKATTESITQDKAMHIKAILDVETEDTQPHQEIGTLEQISIDGSFKLRFERDHRRTVDLTAPEGMQEDLRLLWGRRAQVNYRETIKSHPQREHQTTEYEFINIREAPQYPQAPIEFE